MEILQWSISIKLCLYAGVFTLNFGGMLEYLHYTLVVWWSISIKLNGNTPPYHQSLMEILQHTTKV
jgi:hypothetical protein